MSRNGFPKLVERTRRVREHLGDDRLHGRAGKRRLAGEHLVRHRTERVEVDARVDRLLAHRLLGTHVLRRAEREAGLRHARSARLLHGERDAEVRDERVPALQQNVLGLDVAMDHAVLVRVVERVGDLARDAQRVVDRKLPLARQADRAATRRRRTASRRTGVRRRRPSRAAAGCADAAALPSS